MDSGKLQSIEEASKDDEYVGRICGPKTRLSTFRFFLNFLKTLSLKESLYLEIPKAFELVGDNLVCVSTYLLKASIRVFRVTTVR